jgi:hypothetical protein
MADWITVTKTRRQVWAVWLASMLPVLLLLIGQTVGGAWEGAVSKAWVWLLACLLPSLALILSSLLLNRQPKSMTPPGAHTALVGGTLVYGALALFSLFSATMLGSGERSAIAQLEQSYWWMLPLQAVLIGACYLIFFRGEAVFRPNENLLRSAAAKSAADAASKGHPLQERCRNSIAAAQYDEVFELLKAHFQEKNRAECFDAALLLQNQHNTLLRDKEQGLLDHAQAQIQINRITAALLNLSDQIKD